MSAARLFAATAEFRGRWWRGAMLEQFSQVIEVQDRGTLLQ